MRIPIHGKGRDQGRLMNFEKRWRRAVYFEYNITLAGKIR